MNQALLALRPLIFFFDFVDIPGHQNFFPNALRSLFGLDLAILTIAADDGVMPQTIEHLEVLKGLNLKEGFVVLTKCDLVDKETLKLREVEIAQHIKNSPFQNKPIVRFSLIQNLGKEEIIAHLEQLALNLNKKPDGKLFRFFIDRAFILKGKGKVVTGLATSGKLEEGEKLQIYPQESLAVVREIERHGKKIAKIQEGERAGLNLSTKEDLKRGFVLGRINELKTSKIVNVKLTVFPSSPRSLFNREKIFVYHYSAETTAKIILWKKEELKPGESAMAQLRLTSPIIPFFGDSITIRFFAPRTTAASGTIIDAHSIKLRQGNFFYFENIQTLQAEKEKAFLAPLARSFTLSPIELSQQTGFTLDEVKKNLSFLAEKKKVILVDKNTVIARARFDQAKENLIKRLTEIQKNPSTPSCMTLQELYTRVSPPFTLLIFKLLIKETQNELGLEFKENQYWFKNRLFAEKQTYLRNLILERFTTGSPIREAEILSIDGYQEKDLFLTLKSLLKEGKVIKFKDGAYMEKTGFEKAKDKIVDYLIVNNEISTVEAKNLLGWGRRATISFLEHLDRLKVTSRKGDKRKLY